MRSEIMLMGLAYLEFLRTINIKSSLCKYIVEPKDQEILSLLARESFI